MNTAELESQLTTYFGSLEDAMGPVVTPAGPPPAIPPGDRRDGVRGVGMVGAVACAVLLIVGLVAVTGAIGGDPPRPIGSPAPTTPATDGDDSSAVVTSPQDDMSTTVPSVAPSSSVVEPSQAQRDLAATKAVLGDLRVGDDCDDISPRLADLRIDAVPMRPFVGSYSDAASCVIAGWAYTSVFDAPDLGDPDADGYFAVPIYGDDGTVIDWEVAPPETRDTVGH